MDDITYPGTETEMNDCCGKSSISQELDFVDHWADLTIEKEVLRGSKLREEKNKVPQGRDDWAVVNVDYVKSPCVDYTYFRKSSGKKKNKTFSCASPRSVSPQRRHCSPSYSYNAQALYCRPQSMKPKCLPRCPLRIAELAVPTKRQCIDTWRNKCDILPSFMVDRLKQQVMDEKPIVHITDAINCFKRRKPVSIKSTKRPKRFNRDSKLNEDRMTELRQLCVIFGNKIAQKLITPKNLKLNPELYQISRIVADDVANIMQNRKFDKNTINDRMQAEISEKIAVWVATVLEDTSYKLLEEDLRAKKRTERIMKEDGLLTLVKLSHLDTELEEEEGPVLDFIDDLIDNVMNVCEPQADEGGQRDDFSDKTSKHSGEECDTSISLDKNELDTSSLKMSIAYDTGDNVTNNISNDKEPLTGSIQSEDLQEQDSHPLRQIIDKIVDLVVDDNLANDETDTARVENEDIADSVEESFDNATQEAETALVDNEDTYDNVEVRLENFTQANEAVPVENENIADNVEVRVENFTQPEPDLEENEDVPDNIRERLENVKQEPETAVIEKDDTVNNVEEHLNHDTQKPDTALVENNDTANNVEKRLDNFIQAQREVYELQRVNVPELAPIEGVTLHIKSSDHLLGTNHIDDLNGSKAENDNVSDVIEMFTKESRDDKSKKVKFSEIDLDIRGRFGKLEDNGAQQVKDLHKVGISPSATSIEKNKKIVFGSPNENLLSDADESWPEDISTSILKATESVNRSVTSLGNILERDEKASLSQELQITDMKLEQLGNKTEIDKNTRKEAVPKSSEEGTELYSARQKIAGPVKTESSEEFYHEILSNELEAAFSVKLNDQNKNNGAGKATNATIKAIELEPGSRSTPLHIIPDNKESKRNHETYSLVNGRETIRYRSRDHRDSHTSSMYEGVQQKLNSPYAISEPKFNYKVDPNMAPAWLRHDHGRGEPSDEAFRNRCKPKEKIKESEIRFWCKDLERIFTNLDLWNGWLKTSCHNITYLKQKRDVNKSHAPGISGGSSGVRRKDAKDWITLKKNIDKDAILWKKLNQRAYVRLKNYKAKILLNQNKQMRQALSPHSYKTILETMEDIDRMCFWIHRTIVSTEYCMCCCKNNISGR